MFCPPGEPKKGISSWTTSFFIINSRLELAKNHAKAKQHPEAELLLSENYSFALSTLSSKNNGRDSKKCAKNNCVSFNEIEWLMTVKMRLKVKIDHIDTTQIDLGLNMDKNRVNIKIVSVWWLLYALSNI